MARTRILARAVTVVLALTMLTVYVVSSQRRHNQGAFVLNAAAEGPEINRTTEIKWREMVAYGSKSGPVFVPETQPIVTNKVNATNSSKAKKTSGGTNFGKGQIVFTGTNSPSTKTRYATNMSVSRTDEIVISSSKSLVVFQPGDVVFFKTNQAPAKAQGK